VRDLAALLSGSYAIILAGVFRGVVEGDADGDGVCAARRRSSPTPIRRLMDWILGSRAELSTWSRHPTRRRGVATPPPECVVPPPIVAHDGGGQTGRSDRLFSFGCRGRPTKPATRRSSHNPDLTAQRCRSAMPPLTLTAALYGTCGNTAAEVTGAPVSRNRRVRHSGA